MAIDSIGKYLEYNNLYNYASMLRDYVNSRSYAAYDTGDRARDCIAGIAELEQRRETLRGKFIEAIGGLPPMDTPLNAVVTGIVQGEGYRVEKVIFESRPKSYVTANLYVPDSLTSPSGAVLFLCGHFEHAKHAQEYHDVCLAIAQAGLIVLAQDPVGQGERLSYYDPVLRETTVPWGVPEHSYAGHQCLMAGESIARYFVHDAMRGIDYLCTRPEVDPARIGVTGNSGGGTQTSLVMICDRRVAAAAPTTFIMSRRAYQQTDQAQDLEQIWSGMTALGFDHEDIILAMAPKPVLVNAVAYDFFPIEGTRSTMARVRRFWEMAGCGDNLQSSEDLSDHHYTPALAQASARFFARHLLGKEYVPDEKHLPALDIRLLQCTGSGQVRGDFPDARAVHEETLDRLAVNEEWKHGLSDGEIKRQAIAWLKEKVFNGREPCEMNPRYTQSEVFNGLVLQSCAWRTQMGLMNHGLMFRNVRFTGRELPLTIAVWEGGTHAVSTHLKWIYGQCGAGRAVLILDLTGDGVLTPHNNGSLAAGDYYGPLYKYGCDLIWLGDSIAALRIYEVIRSLDMAARWPGVAKQGLRLYGEGMGLLYTACAALLDGRADGPEPSMDGYTVAALATERHYDDANIICGYIPGMLRYFDVPDLVRWKECGNG